MAGAYAHLTVTMGVCDAGRLETKRCPEDAVAALLDYPEFCALGAVSPDYPYLALPPSEKHRKWADAVHLGMRTRGVLLAGIDGVGGLEGEDRNRAFAWLAGLLTHIVTDVTVHPVINLKVGPYAFNKQAHRICEMHQDAFIFHDRTGLEITEAEFFKTGVMQCFAPGGRKLHPAVTGVWKSILKTAFPEQYEESPPEIDVWHSGFVVLVDKFAEENRSPFFSRHLVDAGMQYPTLGEIDYKEYIDALEVPGESGRMSYGDIFDRALENALDAVVMLAGAVYADAPEAFNRFASNWNLDTGRKEGDMQYWA